MFGRNSGLFIHDALGSARLPTRLVASAVASSLVLLLILLGEALQLPTWAWLGGEPVLARPARWDGRVGSRERLAEAALGSEGDAHTNTTAIRQNTTAMYVGDAHDLAVVLVSGIRAPKRGGLRTWSLGVAGDAWDRR